MNAHRAGVTPLGLIRPEWRFFTLGTLGSVVLALATPLLPLLVVQPLFADVLGRSQFDRLPGLILTAVAILAASSLALWMQDALYGIGAARFGRRVRQAVFASLIGAEHTLVPEDRSSTTSTSNAVTTRAALDVRELEVFYAGELTSIVGQGLVMIAVAVALLVSSPLLTLGLLAVMLPLTVGMQLLSKRIEAAFKATQRHASSASGRMAEALQKLEVVKAFRAESRVLSIFGAANKAQESSTITRFTLSALNAPLSQLASGLGIVVLLLLAASEVRAGRMTIATLTAYVSLLAFAIAPIQIFARAFSRFAAMRDPARRLGEVMNTAPPPETGTLTAVPHGDLRLEEITLRYAGEPEAAVQGVTMIVKTGEMLALVGASGSGKTTVSRGLLRFLEPESGRIMIGSHDLREFTRAAARGAFSYVPQSPNLFAGTARQNLELFGDGIEDAKLWEALRLAGLEVEIRALPLGLGTQLGEDGTGLSGGQRQRLAIARALLSDAPFLLFDEPTANLDAHSEAAIRNVLMNLRGTKTIIVIAHRLSTIQYADQIIVLERGRVVERGTHTELKLESGRYARLLEANG